MGRKHVMLGDRHEDERGVIMDLLHGPVDSVTLIQTRQGAVRGNHYHKRTTQWTFVRKGMLRVTNGHKERKLGPGEMMVHHPGDPHAWKALVDSECLVFTLGPRAGRDYEEDTYRLDVPLLS